LTQIKKGIRPEQRYLTAGGTDWAAARNPAGEPDAGALLMREKIGASAL
jgi:hypothetical protein